MSRGALVPSILTPDQAEEQLALPCLLILAGVAQPTFPTRDRGTPSPTVVILRTSAARVTIGHLPAQVLPFAVDWRQWRTAVVPVLEDETWRTTNPVTAALLQSSGGSQRLIVLMGRALRASFVGAGWGPES